MNARNTSATYHKTSIEAAQTSYTTISHIGQKRNREAFQSDVVASDLANHGSFKRPTLHMKCFAPLKASRILSDGVQGLSEYSQRRMLALTPAPETDPRLHLSHPSYGLPAKLVENFAAQGVRSIYPWQSECLLGSDTLKGDRNLVYTAPTGGGKSLVADVLMVKKVLENPGQKAILVLPYVALVQEKLKWLRNIVDGVTKSSAEASRTERPQVWRKRGDEEVVRVAGLFGGTKSQITWSDIDIAVCTIEKANSLVNTVIEERTIGSLGTVVIDELHMIDDESRGYILELMATKLLSLEQKVQLIGMSATLNNAELLAKWLGDAKFYIARYRPVPVEEHLVFDNAIYAAETSSKFYKTATQLTGHTQPSSQIKPEPVRSIQTSQFKELSNPLINAVVSLANETVRAGYGALVFCSSRAGCERDAIIISQVLPRPEQVDNVTMDKRLDLLNDLRSTPTGLDATLEKTIPVGVAFHHAGLTAEERDLIATAYDSGVVKVIVATCSLAAGINLPARRVILHGARMGADLVGPSMLRQMKGRAGRKGKDEIGETYLCCQKSDLEEVAELMQADIPNVESCLLPGKMGIKRALLEVIATNLATCEDSLDDYMKKTLLYHSITLEELALTLSTSLDELSENGLIVNNESAYEATLLGQAVVASSLTPEDGLFVHRELVKTLRGFAMDSDMHALYSFTPVQATPSSVNWQTFRQEVERLDEASLRILSFIGLKPTLINKLAHGATLPSTTPTDLENARIYRRFYSALQLRDLCNEMPIHAVAKKYDIPRGIVQNLAQTCHGFAAGIVKFCVRMGWGGLAAVLEHFVDRLKAGAKADLLALAEITYIKSRTARVFWENGYKTVGAVAAADPKDLLPVLLMAQPRKPSLSPDQEARYIEKLRGKVEIISNSANKLWERQMQQELDEEE